jgi:hypothetical protein
MRESRKTQGRVRITLFVTGLFFMVALLSELVFYRAFDNDPLLWASIWAMSLGGLGAIASIFLLVLKLVPQPALNKSEEIEVVGRIFLGCLFSLVFAVTVVPAALLDFLSYIGHPTADGPKGGVTLLLPFLSGYSIPLVLGILGKATQAVEVVLALDERRNAVPPRAPRRRRPLSGPASGP